MNISTIVNVIVKIRNKGILPAGKVDIKIESKNKFQQKGQSQWIAIPNVSVGEQNLVVNMDIKGAGCHDILLKQI